MEKEINFKIKKAYSETLFIINNLEPALYRKIPYKLISFLNNNKDNDYVVNIDLNKSINGQNLLSETRSLLAVIYRDYICSKEKKLKILKEEEKYFQERKSKLFDMFNNKNNTRKNDNVDIDIQTPEENGLTIVKENIFTKFKNFIKMFFIKKT